MNTFQNFFLHGYLSSSSLSLYFGIYSVVSLKVVCQNAMGCRNVQLYEYSCVCVCTAYISITFPSVVHLLRNRALGWHTWGAMVEWCIENLSAVVQKNFKQAYLC